jgi:hypothetical protein
MRLAVLPGGGKTMKATDLLKKQHREVESLFKQAKSAEPAERRAIVDEISEKLRHHMEIEENIFYPAVRELGTKKSDEMVPEAYEEHHVVTLVLDELPDVDLEDERFEAKMTVLEELIEHHVEEEEKEMFKSAEKLGKGRLEELGAEMESGVEAGAADEDEEEDDDDMDEDDDEEVVEAEERGAPSTTGGRGKGGARRSA